MKIINTLTSTTTAAVALLASAGQIASALPAPTLHSRQTNINGQCRPVDSKGYSMLFNWVAPAAAVESAPTIELRATSGLETKVLWSEAVPPGRDALTVDYVVNTDVRNASLFWNTVIDGNIPEKPTASNSAANITLDIAPEAFELGIMLNGQSVDGSTSIILTNCREPSTA